MEVTDDEIWDLIHEARNFADIDTSLSDPAKRMGYVEDWMLDSRHIFLNYQIEYVALLIRISEAVPNYELGPTHVKSPIHPI